jgi:hypothetical protein
MPTVIVYGLGGYDPEKENDNIVEQYEIPDPEPTEQELNRQSAKSKLAALGLSEEEVQALLG